MNHAAPSINPADHPASAAYDADSFVGPTGSVEILPLIGADPEDRMVTGPDGQLKNLGPIAEHPSTDTRFDAPTGDFAPRQPSGERNQNADALNVATNFVVAHTATRPSGTVYRSRVTAGAHRRR